MERDLRGSKLDGQPRGTGRAAADHDDGFPVGQRRYRLGPARPAPPQAGAMLVATAERSYIVVQEGTIKAAGPRQQDDAFYTVRGSYKETTASGELYLAR